MAKKKPSRPTRPTASGRRPSTRSTGRRPRTGSAVASPGIPGASPGAYEATCRALVVFAAPSERSDATARAIAEAAVRASIGEGYVVEPLGAGARDDRVSRADDATIPVGEAWAAARALEAHRDIADAEPAIEAGATGRGVSGVAPAATLACSARSRSSRAGAQARNITPTRLAREGSAALRARLG